LKPSVVVVVLQTHQAQAVVLVVASLVMVEAPVAKVVLLETIVLEVAVGVLVDTVATGVEKTLVALVVAVRVDKISTAGLQELMDTVVVLEYSVKVLAARLGLRLEEVEAMHQVTQHSLALVSLVAGEQVWKTTRMRTVASVATVR